MHRKVKFSSAAVIALCLAVGLKAADGDPPKFALGFENCPASPIQGTDGELKTFEFFVTLTTTDNITVGSQGILEGAKGWAIGFEVDGATLKPYTIETALMGVIVNTMYDKDNNKNTPPVAAELDLSEAGFPVADPATAPNPDPLKPPFKGGMSAIILHLTKLQVLLPTGTQRIVKFSIEAKVPTTVTLRFRDGMNNSGGQPFDKSITWGPNSKSVTPTVGTCTFELKGSTVTPCSLPNDVAFYFGDKAQTAAFDVANAETVKVGLRNKAIAGLGFSLGIKKAAGVLTFEDNLNTPPVFMAFTKTDGTEVNNENANLKGNTATGAPAANKITGITMDPALPSTGVFVGIAIDATGDWATIGYVADISGSNAIIPAITETPPDCGIQNVLTVSMVGVIPPKKFSRGDANGDGKINVTDGVLVAQNIFLSKLVFFDCKDMLDTDDNGVLNTNDPVYLLTYIFLKGPAPLAPFKTCAADPTTTTDTLECVAPNCQ